MAFPDSPRAERRRDDLACSITSRSATRSASTAPFGMAYLREDAPRDILCLAGGSGLSPMVSISRAAAKSPALKGRNIHFIYGGRTPRDVCGEAMLKELEGFGERIHYHGAISMPDDPSSANWTGHVGFVHDIAEQMFGEKLSEFEVYFAGPPLMSQAVMKTLIKSKVPASPDALRPVLLRARVARERPRTSINKRQEMPMSKLKLTFGCWNYDRTRALQDGSVQPDGIDLNYLDMPVEETFFRMAAAPRVRRRGDVAVVLLRVAAPRPAPFVAIPVFPSRFFRHSCIYVNAKSGIREPKDLIGKRIGMPEYQMTAPVWIRGILSDHYGVPVDSVDVFHRRRGRAGPPREDEARPAAQHQGRADPRARRWRRCWATARSTRCTRRACPRPSTARTCKRLFANYRDVERDYFRKTEDLPDHAHGRDPPRRVRGQPLDRAGAVQGVPAGAAQDLRRPAAKPPR